MNNFAIEASQLVKTFPGGLVILNGLDLNVHRGSVFGLLGCNGAGKTTLLRVLTGLLHQDGGSLRTLGKDPLRAPSSIRESIAYVPQSFQLPFWMSPEELTRYWGRLSSRFNPNQAFDLAFRWDLPWKRKIGRLSHGEQKKLAFVMSLASNPELLILDEPGEGFDVMSRKELNQQIIELVDYNSDTTVLISTHQVSDLEKLADHVGFMHEGKIPVAASMDELLSQVKKVQIIYDRPVTEEEIEIPGALKIEVLGPVVTALVRWQDDDFLLHFKKMPGVQVNEFPLSLEQLFIEFMESPDEVFHQWRQPEQFAVVA